MRIERYWNKLRVFALRDVFWGQNQIIHFERYFKKLRVCVFVLLSVTDHSLVYIVYVYIDTVADVGYVALQTPMLDLA